ncbi:hypothetical protein AALA61_08825 [Oscillospiraceae bacterium 42-9]
MVFGAVAGVLFSSLKVNFQVLFTVANVLQTSPAFTGVVGALITEYPEISKLISAQRRCRNAQKLNKFIITYGHTFSTLALQNGVDIKTVSGMLDHYSTGFTLDTYAHVTTAAQKEAAKTMDNLLSGNV